LQLKLWAHEPFFFFWFFTSYLFHIFRLHLSEHENWNYSKGKAWCYVCTFIQFLLCNFFTCTFVVKPLSFEGIFHLSNFTKLSSYYRWLPFNWEWEFALLFLAFCMIFISIRNLFHIIHCITQQNNLKNQFNFFYKSEPTLTIL
jgi:hypothetical protein